MSLIKKNRDLRGFGAPTRSTSTTDDLYDMTVVDQGFSTPLPSEYRPAASSPSAVMDSMADVFLRSTSVAFHAAGFIARLKDRLEVDQTARSFTVIFAHPSKIDFASSRREYHRLLHWFAEPEEEILVDTVSAADIDSVVHSSGAAYSSRPVDFEPIDE